MKANLLTLIAIFGLVGCATQNAKTDNFGSEDGVSSRTPAKEENKCLDEVAKSEDWECKQARPSDFADQYMWDKNGKDRKFSRYFKRSGKKGLSCGITTNVEGFKIATHPLDEAVVYFQKDNNIYWLKNEDKAFDGKQCPKAVKDLLVENADINDGFKVGPQREGGAPIVSAAVDRTGIFRAWEKALEVKKIPHVVEFQINQNYGQDKPFSSIAIFVLDKNGDVHKVKVRMNEKNEVEDLTVVQQGNWKKLVDWKKSVGLVD